MLNGLNNKSKNKLDDDTRADADADAKNRKKRKNVDDEEKENSDDLYPLSKIQMRWQIVSKIGSGLQEFRQHVLLERGVAVSHVHASIGELFLEQRTPKA